MGPPEDLIVSGKFLVKSPDFLNSLLSFLSLRLSFPFICLICFLVKRAGKPGMSISSIPSTSTDGIIGVIFSKSIVGNWSSMFMEGLFTKIKL